MILNKFPQLRFHLRWSHTTTILPRQFYSRSCCAAAGCTCNPTHTQTTHTCFWRDLAWRTRLENVPHEAMNCFVCWISACCFLYSLTCVPRTEKNGSRSSHFHFQKSKRSQSNLNKSPSRRRLSRVHQPSTVLAKAGTSRVMDHHVHLIFGRTHSRRETHQAASRGDDAGR